MLVSVLLAAVLATNSIIGLGVKATASNQAVVKVNGKDLTIRLRGVPSGSEPARAFLDCLIASRVVRVSAAQGRLWMLDENLVNDQVLEFITVPSETEPCLRGKAAYTGPRRNQLRPLPVVKSRH